MIKKTVFTLLASLILLAGANSQILTAFDVSGTGTTTTGPSAAVQNGVTASALTRGSGITFVSSANAFNSNNWNLTNTLDTTNATGKYIYFDVTAGAAAVTFSTLQFAINGSNTAPNQGQWAYTLDSGTSFTLGTTANGGAFTTTNAQPTAQSIWDFTDFTLTPGSTVEFRFFEYGATPINAGSTESAAGTTRIANITGAGNPQYDLVVNGPIAAVQPVNAAPEPSTLAVLGAAALLMSLVVYRRNQAA